MGTGMGGTGPGRLALVLVSVITVGALVACTGPNPAYVGTDARAAGGARADAAGAIDVGDSFDTTPLPADTAVATPDTAMAIPDTAPSAPDAAAPLPDSAAPPPDTASLPIDSAAPPPVDAPVDAGPGANTRYNFESALQGWGDLRPGRQPPPVITRVTAPAPAWNGQWSLSLDLRSGASDTHRLIGIAQEFRATLPANTTISYRLWLPAGDALDYVQPFVLYYKPADADGDPQWGGIDPPLFATSLARGQWVTITHRVPANADARGVVEVGLEFVLRPSRSLAVYVDGVHW